MMARLLVGLSVLVGLVTVLVIGNTQSPALPDVADGGRGAFGERPAALQESVTVEPAQHRESPSRTLVERVREREDDQREESAAVDPAVQAAGIRPDHELTSRQRLEMQLAYDRFRERYSELAKKRMEVAQPLIERKWAEGQVLVRLIPDPGSGVQFDALPRSDYEFWSGRLEKHPNTGRKQITFALVGPGELAEFDLLSNEIALARSEYQSEAARIAWSQTGR